jgi:hypothetical protein
VRTGSQSSRPTVASFDVSGAEPLGSATAVTVSRTVINFIFRQNVGYHST